MSTRIPAGRGPVRPFTAVLAAVATLLATPLPSALAAVGDVSGRLVGPDGAPLSGYIVRLVGEEGPAAESPPTDASGRFRFSNVPAGQYAFELLSRDRRACHTSIAPAVMPEAGSIEINVRLTVVPVCDERMEPVDAPPPGAARGAKTGGRSRLGLGLGIAGGIALLLAAADGGGDGASPPVSPSSP